MNDEIERLQIEADHRHLSQSGFRVIRRLPEYNNSILKISKHFLHKSLIAWHLCDSFKLTVNVQMLKKKSIMK